MLFSIPQNGELTLRKFGDSNLLITTYVSPPNEAAAWPGRRYPMGDKAVAWPDAAFLQITFHAGCRYTHF